MVNVYRSSIGKSKASQWLNIEWTLAFFAKRKSAVVKRYAMFVAEGVNQPSSWERLTSQVFLGSEETVSACHSGGYTLKELGDRFGLHYSIVSSIVKYHNQ